MRARPVESQSIDRAVGFALAYTAAAVFVLLLLSGPQPGLFLPLGIVALPLAAGPRHRAAAEVASALGLLALAAALGGTAWLFAPGSAALLLSAYRRRASPHARRARRKSRRA